MSSELIDKVSEILKKVDIPDRHTFFQIEKFIIGKETTVHSQFWAIIRELQARLETIRAFEKELKDAEDNLELFDLRIEKLDITIKLLAQEEPNPYQEVNIKENEINIRKLQREKQGLIEASIKLNKKNKSILEEIGFLVKCYETIVNNYKDIKPLDDPEAQKEMWNEKLLEEFNLRLIFQRPFDSDFVKTILCLDETSSVRKQMVSLVNNIQMKMIEDKSVKLQSKVDNK